MSTLRRFAFPAAVVVVVLLHLAIVVPGFFLTRLWEDEAYNLSVSINLAHGLGYSSDGYLLTGPFAPFDHRISTGPVVLLPIAAVLAAGVDPLIGARLVMMLFYAVLVVAAWFVGRFVGGRWAAVAAVAAVALFDPGVQSPLQGPTDVLGEVPAAAFLLLSLWFARRHPLLSGLAFGLALQCKALSVLSLPAIGLGVLLMLAASSPGRRLLRGLLFAAAALVPTALFELSKLIVLGPAAYIDSTKLVARFLLSGGQPDMDVSPGDKLLTLAGGWFLPAPLVVVLAVGALAVVIVALVRRSVPLDRERVVTVLVASTALLTTLGWWVLSSHQPAWLRHPSSAILAYVPVLVAGTVWAARQLRPGWRALVAVVLAAVFAAQGIGHITKAFTPVYYETLGEQRSIAAELRALEPGLVQVPWGAGVSLVVLAGLHGIPIGAPGAAGHPMLLVNFDGAPAAIEAWEQDIDDRCESIIQRWDRYVLCEPRD